MYQEKYYNGKSRRRMQKKIGRKEETDMRKYNGICYCYLAEVLINLLLLCNVNKRARRNS